MQSTKRHLPALFALALLTACSGRNVGTWNDAGAPPDADLPDAASTQDADLSTLCPLDATGTASATGHSPLGTFQAHLAWFGQYYGECGGMRVLIVPDRATLERILATDPWHWPTEDDNVVILNPENYDHQNGGWINTGPVSVTHYYYGSTMVTIGTVTITEYIRGTSTPETIPEPVVRATFTVNEPGWSLSGRVDAPQCVDLFIGCV